MATPLKFAVILTVTVDDESKLAAFAKDAWRTQDLGYPRRPSTTVPPIARHISDFVSAAIWREDWAVEPNDAGLDITTSNVLAYTNKDRS